VRVPVFYGHSEAVHIETREKLTRRRARELLEAAPGVEVVDERKAGGYPTRRSPMPRATIRSTSAASARTFSHPRGLNLWVVSDNIRKGAALNAVQIAELAPAPVATESTGFASDSYGPVAAGETLWSIASRTRPDSDVSVNQMMVALLRANPDAFIGNNINRLRSGAVLRIPGREDAVATAAAEAAAQVREQTQVWRDTVQPSPQPAEADSYTGLVEPSSSSAPAPDSRLELTPPTGDDASATQSGASASGEGRELRADLARSREEVGTLKQENVELKSRVGELEKLQGDSSRLIELKDSELAAAQRRLAELEARVAAADAATPVDSATPATDAFPPPIETVTDTPASVADSALPADDMTPAGTDPDAATAATDPSATTAEGEEVTPPMGFESGTDADAAAAAALPAETAPVAAPPAVAPATDTAATPPPPAATPWYANPWILGGGGLALVGLIALLAGRRRNAATAPAPRYSSDALAASVAAAQASAPAAVVAVDGDDREGELIEAISRDPSDLQRHLELVRHYYDTGDASGFENAAEAMYSRVYDPEDDAWQEVVALGQEIAPEHPLFVATGAVQADMEPAPTPPPVAAREVAWNAQPISLSPPAPVVVPTPAPAPAPLDDFRYDTAPSETYAGDLGDAEDTGSDAAATKLELARAYLDMGDVEGARGMLEEVLGEGNAAQRNDARRLLDEIR
jgi:pilus assembly protein FimV